MLRKTFYLLKKQHVKSKTKCDYEEAENDEKLSECFQDIGEHDNINSKFREFPHEKNKTKPGEPNRKCTNASVPKPASATK